ncbi:kinase-like domain-containing protein, partial [Dendryphion nanum]
PYESIRLLGHGGCGLVDEVVIRGAATRECYARKQVTMGKPARRKEMVKQLQDEARIIRRLNHPHVVTVISTYTRGAVFGILMSPVADTDLKQFLEVTHEIDQWGDKMRLHGMVWRWIGCLIRGLDYIHEMRVKHRDIKPSNILIKDNRVLFTDFGISKTIPQDDTTGSDGTFGPMTRKYIAPEALKESGRRGRAMDIYSLGCVFLEITAAL